MKINKLIDWLDYVGENAQVDGKGRTPNCDPEYDELMAVLLEHRQMQEMKYEWVKSPLVDTYTIDGDKQTYAATFLAADPDRLYVYKLVLDEDAYYGTLDQLRDKVIAYDEEEE